MPRPVDYLLAFWIAARLVGPAGAEDRAGTEFFEKKIRPVLVARCYECHSLRSPSLKGGLRLDTPDGLRRGGESGPAVEPGKPDESLLIQALRHEAFEMPPQGRLPEPVIADFATWVKMGAPDPRGAADPLTAGDDWEERFQARRRWWSAQPLGNPTPPRVRREAWCRNEIDRFVLARVEAAGLQPAPEADRQILLRRLSFALIGLPPSEADTAYFLADPSPQPYERLVARMLASPQFGERWARHWMDVVHYADTHGYEWDIPAKGAWMYRDYLIRAFNQDVPFAQLILEHLAGDLLPQPRIDRQTNLNESMIGVCSLRLGERRHGDSAEFEGIHQEAIDNVIDTVSKTFQATTVACARCHDHKLDAVAQADYYALAGALMSSRWVPRVVDAGDPNEQSIGSLRHLKARLRPLLAELWLKDLDGLAKKLPSLLTGAKADDQPLAPWHKLREAVSQGEDVSAVWRRLADQYRALHDQRAAENKKNLRLVADFTHGTLPAGWNAEGFGLRHGFVADGEPVVADRGPQAVRHLLPAGLYTHVDSPRLSGALRSPLWSADAPWLSYELVAGDLASLHVVVDNALFPESRYQFLQHSLLATHTVSTLPEEIARGRRIYVELNTKALNNYYPPRVGLVQKYTADEREGPRSWFGVSRVWAHDAPASAPRDEHKRFQRLFQGPSPQTAAEAAARWESWFRSAVERWRDQQADGEDVALMNWLLANQLLTNRADASKSLADLVNEYRTSEAGLKSERVVGGIADLNEGRDERIAIRGSYSEPGKSVPRGYIRLLAGDRSGLAGSASGRLEIARLIASADNPLTARVFVNRVWAHLYGTGLVTTVDDFGHLGEQPSDPELLDWLARRFIDNGWSVKKLIGRIVTSATWRQSGEAYSDAVRKDPDNRLWHHYPLRRLEAEAIRDSILAVSGRLDSQLFGPPIDPFRASEDKDKRLFSGPIDGNGRRSLYIKMTLMEPPKFLSLFNQPLPKLTVGHRDVTNVPDQALALLNDPFVISQAEHWSRRVVHDDCRTVEERVEKMLASALGHASRNDQRRQFAAFVDRMALLRGVTPAEVLASEIVWQDVAHAIFNLKEFLYVR